MGKPRFLDYINEGKIMDLAYNQFFNQFYGNSISQVFLGSDFCFSKC